MATFLHGDGEADAGAGEAWREAQLEQLTKQRSLYATLNNLQLITDGIVYDRFREGGSEDSPVFYPSVGFKIHVPIGVDNSWYLPVLEKVLEVCDQLGDSGHPTVLKVAKPPYFWPIGYSAAGAKSIVIYPNSSGSVIGDIPTNLPETVRFGDVIGPMLMDIPGYKEVEIPQDLRLPSGIWVRYGGMSHDFVNLDGTPENRLAPFWKRYLDLRLDPLSLFDNVNLLEAVGVEVPPNVKDELRKRLWSNN